MPQSHRGCKCLQPPWDQFVFVCLCILSRPVGFNLHKNVLIIHVFGGYYCSASDLWVDGGRSVIALRVIAEHHILLGDWVGTGWGLGWVQLVITRRLVGTFWISVCGQSPTSRLPVAYQSPTSCLPVVYQSPTRERIISLFPASGEDKQNYKNMIASPTPKYIS